VSPRLAQLNRFTQPLLLTNRAVLRYGELKREPAANLRKRLAKSYAMNAALDRHLAEDWFTIDEEAFDRIGR